MPRLPTRREILRRRRPTQPRRLPQPTARSPSDAGVGRRRQSRAWKVLGDRRRAQDFLPTPGSVASTRVVVVMGEALADSHRGTRVVVVTAAQIDLIGTTTRVQPHDPWLTPSIATTTRVETGVPGDVPNLGQVDRTPQPPMNQACCMSTNLDRWPWKAAVMVLVSPLRCLATMKSASPGRSSLL